MRALSASEVLRIWEQGSGRSLLDRALQLLIEPPHVVRVAQGLLIRRLQATIIGWIGRRYAGGHARRGASRSTRESSRTGENGLVR